MWKNASEGIPTDEYVLSYNSEFEIVYISWCDDEGECYNEFGMNCPKPTHWQRIEELPKLPE